MPRHAIRVLVALAAFASAVAPTAGARPAAAGSGSAPVLQQLPGRQGCIEERASKGCGVARAFISPNDLVFSPDGRFAYVVSGLESWGGVSVFRRDRRTGALGQLPGSRGCVSQAGRDRQFGAGSRRVCTTGVGLTDAIDVAVSPDGRNLYALGQNGSSSAGDALTTFRRDARTGALHQLPLPAGCLNRLGGAGCRADRQIDAPATVVVSPDGMTVYVAGSTLLAFHRDPADGHLTRVVGAGGCLAPGAPPPAGCGAMPSATAFSELALAPDGRHLYALGGDVVALTLDAGTGGFVPVAAPGGCLGPSPGCAPAHGLESPWALAFAPDGRQLYVVSYSFDLPEGEPAVLYSSDVAILDVDPATGALTQRSGVAGCVGLRGLHKLPCQRGGLTPLTAVAVTSGGRALVAAGAQGVEVFRRDPVTGALALVPGRAGCIVAAGGPRACARGRLVQHIDKLTPSPDGRHLYAVSSDGYVTAFRVGPNP